MSLYTSHTTFGGMDVHPIDAAYELSINGVPTGIDGLYTIPAMREAGVLLPITEVEAPDRHDNGYHPSTLSALVDSMEQRIFDEALLGTGLPETVELPASLDLAVEASEAEAPTGPAKVEYLPVAAKFYIGAGQVAVDTVLVGSNL
jgi:hypothetical protein